MSHPGYGRDGKRLKAVEQQTPEEMRAEVVGDAVAGHLDGSAQASARLLAQVARTSRLLRVPAESVYQTWDAEVRSLLDGTGLADVVRALTPDRP